MRRVLLAVVGADGEDHAVLADDLGEPGAEVEADAVVGVEVGEELAELGAEDPVERGGVGFDDGDLGAVAAGGRGDFEADPAGARDHQVAVVPAEAGEDLTEPVGVGEPAQVVDAGELGAGDVEAARLGAGGEEQLVVADDGAVAEADGAGLTVYGGDGLPEVQFDVVRRVPGGLVDEDAVAFLGAREVALGQGWALVGVVAFVADEDHPAVEPLGPQGLRRFGPCQAPADDDKGLICVDHVVSSSLRPVPTYAPGRSPGRTASGRACERPARTV